MPPSREKVTAMQNVLNKRWLSQGWRVMDPDDSEAMAMVWIEIMDEHKIPYQHYQELYRRSIGLRAKRLEQGLKCEDFSADLLVACWPGLVKDIEQRRIAEKRYLPDTAESDCPRCFGSGMEVVPGKGARPCKHEPLDPSEIVEKPASNVVPMPKPVREHPKPKTEIGWINQARLDGGDQDVLDRIRDHVIIANQQDEIDNEKSEQ